MAATRLWTAEMVRELPDDGNRYEVVDGTLLVTPSPAQPHQSAALHLAFALRDYLEPLGRLNCLYMSPADISWSPDVLVQPDVFVTVPSEVTGEWSAIKNLRLAIEVLSPSSKRADRFTKRAAYQRYGVQTYWIVDLEARAVEVWHPESEKPEILTSTLTWRVSPEAPLMTLSLPELFAQLPGASR